MVSEFSCCIFLFDKDFGRASFGWNWQQVFLMARYWELAEVDLMDFEEVSGNGRGLCDFLRDEFLFG